MNDDQMNDMLAQAARDYNAPANVPRDEMWTRIQAERNSRRREQMPRRLWVWPTVGVAAAALLAVGVTLGRRMERLSAPSVAPIAANITQPATPPRDSTAELVRQLRQETTATNRRARELATANPARGVAPVAAATRRDDATTSLSYQLVVLKHLAGSEAMITAFRSSAKRGEIDAQIAEWSKDLLSTTRMLEASAASDDDPMMQRLLEDLELVLAQIKQYLTRGTNNPDDLTLIEHSIVKRGVMNKLRTLPGRNVPAGI